MRKVVLISVIVLPLLDLIWNLTHLNIGLVDFYGLAAFAQGCAVNGAWPATPYFPAGYSLLLIPGGLMGSVLIWGYCLSCLGHIIALWSIDRLIRLFGGSQGLALAAIIVAWLAPVYRIVAGSPSVDALYTGLGLWFMVAALAIWRGSQPATDLAPATVGLAQTGGMLGGAVADLPRWAGMGLAVPAILLPVLRYHALVLLLPVLLVLFVWRRRCWQVVLTAAVAVVLAVGFNQVTYFSEYHQPQASATELQIRTGLEITQGGTYYESTEALFADYPAFCEHARSNSLLADYPVTSLLRHVGANWVSYLKRTPIVLAVLGVLLLLAIRRPGLAGLPLAAGWIACYTLTLSAAYYTPRAALLPVLLGIGISAAAWHLLATRRRLLCGALGLLLLIGGYLLSYDYAMVVIRERMDFASASRADWPGKPGTAVYRQSTAAADWRLVPLVGNPWCQPYVTLSRSWIDDPEIRLIQRQGIEFVAPQQLAAGWYGVETVLFPGEEQGSDLFRMFDQRRAWERVESGNSVLVFRRVMDQSGGAAD